MITYAVEKIFPDTIEEIKALFEAHRQEVGHRAPHEKVPKWELNPDYDKYQSLEEQGFLHVCTARDDGKLVGYYVNYIVPLMHYKHVKAAVSDIYFILPDYRKGRVGVRLFQFMKESVESIGVDSIKIHCKVYLDMSPIIKRLGGYPIENVYSIDV